jgi:nucleotide-binding universal stress UspA family protein
METTMSYKTILVNADTSPHAAERIKVAAQLAQTFDAHLVGTAMTGVSRFLMPGSVEMGGAMIADQVALMTEAAHKALQQFDDITRQIGLPSCERRLVNDDLDGGLALQARYADLVVVSQVDRDDGSIAGLHNLPEYVLMNGARPVLVLPYAGLPRTIGKRILVAWDGSQEATRAITAALPLLKLAELVQVVVFNPRAKYEAHGELPGADIALYLSRHGVKVESRSDKISGHVGEALLSLAADVNADLLVMGGYGHARYREMLLGGVTETILHSMTLPVLLAH